MSFRPARRAKAEVLAAVQAKIKALQAEYPGVGVEDRGAEIHITVPDALRVGHEAHFAQVASSFLKYRAGPQHAARLGTPEHAGEVLRHDEGRRVEPEERAPAGAAHRAAVVASGSTHPAIVPPRCDRISSGAYGH